MEQLEIAGHTVLCDVDATRAYRSTYNEPCACESCVYFRQAFPGQYPAAAAALERLGLDVFRPLDCVYIDAQGNELRYYAVYVVQGALPTDPLEGELGGLPARLYREEPSANHDMPEPWFFLEFDFTLPRPEGWTGDGDGAEGRSFVAQLADWLKGLLHGG